MPRSAVQNQQIREATRSAIVESAMLLFARHGYAHTSVRMIARQAEISNGLMYHYFESKEKLLHAVLDSCMGILSAHFVRVREQEQPARRIAGLLETIFDLLRADPDFWGLFYMLRSQPAVMEILGDAFRLWTARLRDLLVADLTALGRAEPRMDALLLYSLIEGTIQQFLLAPATYPLDEVVGRIVQDFTGADDPGNRRAPNHDSV